MPRVKDKERLRIPDLQASTPGVLLLALPSLNPVAYNWEALQILAFPANPPELKRLPTFLTKQLRLKLEVRTSAEGPQFAREFKSGNRTYLCRVLDLRMDHGLKAELHGATTALLLERHLSAAGFLRRRACEAFGLTQREREIVDLVLRGMTTKEIAQMMTVSPNTVKTFLRLIMTKMNVSTRSGIIGAILGSPVR